VLLARTQNERRRLGLAGVELLCLSGIDRIAALATSAARWTFQVIDLLDLGNPRRYQAEYDALARGHEAQGLEGDGVGVVLREKIYVELDRIENLLHDRLVAGVAANSG